MGQLFQRLARAHPGLVYELRDYFRKVYPAKYVAVKVLTVNATADHKDEAITRLLQETPSATYEPRFSPEISADSIIKVKSQPLLNFGPREDASNLELVISHLNDDFSCIPSTAIPAKEHLPEQVQPILLRAPEVILCRAWSTPIDICAIESCPRPYNVMDEQDIFPAAAFIRRCLTIDPNTRPTALELLDDEWPKNT
ncbi:uncharacterized protein EDB91DRAFT_1088600 [Suillus paluster]|uniref:uncharacterized protein n=1 Tax=Suillus paluster TaxID=48578 RepID=UPI001B8664CE|nr:uncharacterized protein EDB91DRAFT_1088600 [Suillus paluster]KAG1721003.1 hypothetical protein EDB91DRAFT_1088600 [Suillus paluster]